MNLPEAKDTLLTQEELDGFDTSHNLWGEYVVDRKAIALAQAEKTARLFQQAGWKSPDEVKGMVEISKDEATAFAMQQECIGGCVPAYVEGDHCACCKQAISSLEVKLKARLEKVE